MRGGKPLSATSREEKCVGLALNGQTSMSGSRLVICKQRIAEFCQRHRIRKLALYGSVLREDFGPESDVDVLVEFEPGHMVGLAIFDIEEELSRLLGGRKVDLVREKYLNRRLRDRVLANAEVLYEEG